MWVGCGWHDHTTAGLGRGWTRMKQKGCHGCGETAFSEEDRSAVPEPERARMC